MNVPSCVKLPRHHQLSLKPGSWQTDVDGNVSAIPEFAPSELEAPRRL